VFCNIKNPALLENNEKQCAMQTYDCIVAGGDGWTKKGRDFSTFHILSY